MCITESLCCTAEIDTTHYINYTTIKNKLIKINFKKLSIFITELEAKQTVLPKFKHTVLFERSILH